MDGKLTLDFKKMDLVIYVGKEGGCTHQETGRRLQDNFWELVLSFHHVRPVHGTQATGRSNKSLYPLSHFAIPTSTVFLICLLFLFFKAGFLYVTLAALELTL